MAVSPCYTGDGERSACPGSHPRPQIKMPNEPIFPRHPTETKRFTARRTNPFGNLAALPAGAPRRALPPQTPRPQFGFVPRFFRELRASLENARLLHPYPPLACRSPRWSYFHTAGVARFMDNPRNSAPPIWVGSTFSPRTRTLLENARLLHPCDPGLPGPPLVLFSNRRVSRASWTASQTPPPQFGFVPRFLREPRAFLENAPLPTLALPDPPLRLFSYRRMSRASWTAPETPLPQFGFVPPFLREPRAFLENAPLPTLALPDPPLRLFSYRRMSRASRTAPETPLPNLGSFHVFSANPVPFSKMPGYPTPAGYPPWLAGTPVGTIFIPADVARLMDSPRNSAPPIWVRSTFSPRTPCLSRKCPATPPPPATHPGLPEPPLGLFSYRRVWRASWTAPQTLLRNLGSFHLFSANPVPFSKMPGYSTPTHPGLPEPRWSCFHTGGCRAPHGRLRNSAPPNLGSFHVISPPAAALSKHLQTAPKVRHRECPRGPMGAETIRGRDFGLSSPSSASPAKKDIRYAPYPGRDPQEIGHGGRLGTVVGPLDLGGTQYGKQLLRIGHQWARWISRGWRFQISRPMASAVRSTALVVTQRSARRFSCARPRRKGGSWPGSWPG